MAVDHLIRYWENALRQPLGIKINTSDRVLLRQQLYRARDGLANKEDFKGLTVTLPKTPKNQIWIIHRERANAAGRSSS